MGSSEQVELVALPVKVAARQTPKSPRLGGATSDRSWGRSGSMSLHRCHRETEAMGQRHTRSTLAKLGFNHIKDLAMHRSKEARVRHRQLLSSRRAA